MTGRVRVTNPINAHAGQSEHDAINDVTFRPLSTWALHTIYVAS